VGKALLLCQILAPNWHLKREELWQKRPDYKVFLNAIDNAVYGEVYDSLTTRLRSYEVYNSGLLCNSIYKVLLQEMSVHDAMEEMQKELEYYYNRH